MILILSGPGDLHADRIEAEMTRRGVAVGRLDPDNFPGISGVSLSLAGAGEIEGSMGSNGRPVVLEDVRAVYCGRPTTMNAQMAIESLWDALDAGVVPGTPPVVERATDPERQLFAAARAGFDARVDGGGAWCATRMRVVVAGYRVFAAALGAYREAPVQNVWDPCVNSSTISTAVLPVSIAERCREVVEDIGLQFATMDIAVGNDGRATFKTLDPYGHYSCIEDATGLPVTRAVVDLLLTEAADVPIVRGGATSVRKTRSHRHVPFLRVARARP